MTQLGLESIYDTKLEEEWKTGATVSNPLDTSNACLQVKTYLGVSTPGYPNMFHIYGPHGPTLLSNGPTSVSVQGRWIVDAIDKMTLNNIKYINPTEKAGKEWKQHILDLNSKSLFPTTRST
jgi:cation diffusion facilitator CzcD-associated flavoprotein CzcO